MMPPTLAAGWINVRKKEPEPLKEEQVIIDIVQQAMENPSANTNVDTVPHPEKKKGIYRKDLETDTLSPEEAEAKAAEKEAKAVEREAKAVERKVKQFFMDFPEPYREKAVKRFSQRTGWYKYDLIWEYAMRHERSVAFNRGVFLEDGRESKEKEQAEEKARIEEIRQAYIKSRQEGEVADWEKKLMEYMPVALDESPGWKFINVLSLAILSTLLFHRTVKQGQSLFRHGSVERWKTYRQMALNMTSSGILGVGSVYRFMDWGPFDRSKDSRDIFTRGIYNVKEDFDKLMDFLDDRKK